MHCLVIEDKEFLKKNNNNLCYLMILVSHKSFGYCCFHDKLGSTAVTWQEGSNPKLTGQGLSQWSCGSIRVPPVDPGSSPTINDLGWGRAKESQRLRTNRSVLISQLLCTSSYSDDKAAKLWTWTPSSAATGQRCVSYSHSCMNY